MLPAEFYRPPANDRYQRQLNRQNSGVPCEHCGSTSGHFDFCALLNRNIAEAQSVISTGQFSVEDQHWLNAIERAFRN